jgi:hypothetical protein
MSERPAEMSANTNPLRRPETSAWAAVGRFTAGYLPQAGSGQRTSAAARSNG